MTQFEMTLQGPHFLALAPATREPAAEAMLRDIAYVLHLTRQVKAEIMAERRARRDFAPTARLAA
ncbi:MAG TPA: hypothetical protein VKD90_20485 [Gemmataceae bacterium]|nr:hypothetical protein [Gemmataceae bacterium]